MDFRFTGEQEKLRQEIAEFCTPENYGEIDPKTKLSLEFYRKAAAKGWLGMAFPREYGGLGLGKTEEAIFSEEIPAHNAPLSIQMYGRTQVLGGTILLDHGNEEQKQFYLPRIARNEIWLGQAFTEEGAGSDLLACRTFASRQGDYYVINGSKTFQSWAPRAPVYREAGINMHVFLMARTSKTASPEQSFSLFFFDVSDLPRGMSVNTFYTMDDQATSDVFFDDVKIPASCLVGEENRAWEYIVKSGIFYWTARLAYYSGVLKGLLPALVRHAREKEHSWSGSKFYSVRNKLAELAIRNEAVRLLTYKFTTAYDKGQETMTAAAALQKFHTDRFIIYLAKTHMEILGPYGQLKKGDKYALFNGEAESTYRFSLRRTFGSTGPSAMTNVIADYALGLPNEFGLIY